MISNMIDFIGFTTITEDETTENANLQKKPNSTKYTCPSKMRKMIEYFLSSENMLFFYIRKNIFSFLCYAFFVSSENIFDIHN